VHTYLSTLQEYGFVVQTDEGYKLGPQLLTLGEYVRNHSELYQAAKDQIENLAEETGECAHLLIESNGQLYAIYERFGENAVGVGYHNRKRERPLTHLHCTAAGKAILAHLPEGRIEEIVARYGLPQNTPNTITDADNLFEAVEEIRERGYSFADEEQIENLRAVAAPITPPESGVVGALAVSGPLARLKGDLYREELPELVTQAANICELNLQSRNPREELM
jgi:DNA-binding IclR family transcriptional regulator